MHRGVGVDEDTCYVNAWRMQLQYPRQLECASDETDIGRYNESTYYVNGPKSLTDHAPSKQQWHKDIRKQGKQDDESLIMTLQTRVHALLLPPDHAYDETVDYAKLKRAMEFTENTAQYIQSTQPEDRGHDTVGGLLKICIKALLQEPGTRAYGLHILSNGMSHKFVEMCSESPTFLEMAMREQHPRSSQQAAR